MLWGRDETFLAGGGGGEIINYGVASCKGGWRRNFAKSSPTRDGMGCLCAGGDGCSSVLVGRRARSRTAFMFLFILL